MATKTTTRTYTVRIEWPVTYYCDTTVEASSIEEAARLAMDDPDYDNQRSYDEPGESEVQGVCEGDDYRYEDREEVPAAGASCDESRHAAMLNHLRQIVEKQEAFFDQNEHGTQAEFQKAADAFHDAIDRAADFLRGIGEQAEGGAA